MRRIALLLVLAACAAPTPTETEPGWHEHPDEPAGRFFGQIHLSWTRHGLLEGTLQLDEATPGLKPYFAVRWANATTTTVLGAPFEDAFAITVDPPASARTAGGCGEEAKGLLLVYLTSGTPDPSRDELVSVSEKSRELFGSLQTIYSQPFVWSPCAGQRPLVPILLQHDPRLRLALCAPGCTEPLFDRTHVVKASVELDPDYDSFSYEILGKWDEVTLEVNGVVVPREPLAQAKWVEGRNRVRITAGSLAPWEAVVVLPPRDLQLTLVDGAPLRTGQPFTLSWSAPWAGSTWVGAYPLDVPVLKVGTPSFSSETETLTDIFPGFVDTMNMPRDVPRAELNARAQLPGRQFELSVNQSIVVDVD